MSKLIDINVYYVNEQTGELLHKHTFNGFEFVQSNDISEKKGIFTVDATTRNNLDKLQQPYINKEPLYLSDGVEDTEFIGWKPFYYIHAGRVEPCVTREGQPSAWTGANISQFFAYNDEAWDSFVVFLSQTDYVPNQNATGFKSLSNVRLCFGNSPKPRDLTDICDGLEDDYEFNSITINDGCMSDSFFSYGSTFCPSINVDMVACDYAQVGRWFSVEYLLDNHLDGYTLLNREPVNWNDTFFEYYTKSGNDYIQVPNDENAPAFSGNTYYRADYTPVWVLFGVFKIKELPQRTSETLSFSGIGVLDALSDEDVSDYIYTGGDLGVVLKGLANYLADKNIFAPIVCDFWERFVDNDVNSTARQFPCIVTENEGFLDSGYRQKLTNEKATLQANITEYNRILRLLNSEVIKDKKEIAHFEKAKTSAEDRIKEIDEYLSDYNDRPYISSYSLKDDKISLRSALSYIAVATHSNIVEKCGELRIVHIGIDTEGVKSDVFLFDDDYYTDEPLISDYTYFPSPININCRQQRTTEELKQKDSLYSIYMESDTEVEIFPSLEPSDNNLISYPLTIDAEPLQLQVARLGTSHWGDKGWVIHNFRERVEEVGLNSSFYYKPISVEMCGYHPCLRVGGRFGVKFEDTVRDYNAFIGNVTYSYDGELTTKIETPCDIEIGGNVSSSSGSSGASSNAGQGTYASLIYNISNTTIIKENVLEGKKLVDKTIEGSKIADSTIENSHIADSTIEGSKIKFSTFENGVISGSAIDTSTFTKGQISGSVIDTSTFVNGSIKGSVIDSSTLTNIPQASIKDLQTDYAHITEGVIDNATINGKNIKNSSIFARALSEDLVETVLGVKVYYQAEQPTNANKDDIWYVTAAGQDYNPTTDVIKVYDGSNWIEQTIADSIFMANTITAQNIVANSIGANEITVEDIIGTNGWINLHKGTFNYGNGKLAWNGSKLSVNGKIDSKEGTIGGWNILERGFETSRGSAETLTQSFVELTNQNSTAHPVGMNGFMCTHNSNGNDYWSNSKYAMGSFSLYGYAQKRSSGNLMYGSSISAMADTSSDLATIKLGVLNKTNGSYTDTVEIASQVNSTYKGGMITTKGAGARFVCNNGTNSIGLMINTAGTYMGIYDNTNAKWIISKSTSGEVLVDSHSPYPKVQQLSLKRGSFVSGRTKRLTVDNNLVYVECCVGGLSIANSSWTSVASVPTAYAPSSTTSVAVTCLGFSSDDTSGTAYLMACRLGSDGTIYVRRTASSGTVAQVHINFTYSISSQA